jgi:hypothetical protein
MLRQSSPQVKLSPVILICYLSDKIIDESYLAQERDAGMY